MAFSDIRSYVNINDFASTLHSATLLAFLILRMDDLQFLFGKLKTFYIQYQNKTS